MLCTIVHTKDSVRGSNIVIHLDCNPGSILASGEITDYPWSYSPLFALLTTEYG